MDGIQWLWVALAILVVVVVIGLVARSASAKKKERNRADAEALRTRAQSHEHDLRDREAQAAVADAEARRARAEAEAQAAEADRRAAEADRLEVQAARSGEHRDDLHRRHQEQLREADRLDPDVRTDKEGRRLDGDHHDNGLRDGGSQSGAVHPAGGDDRFDNDRRLAGTQHTGDDRPARGGDVDRVTHREADGGERVHHTGTADGGEYRVYDQDRADIADQERRGRFDDRSGENGGLGDDAEGRGRLRRFEAHPGDETR